MRDELTIDELVGQVSLIQQAMSKVMHDGEHYGVIPGTGSKPTLLKPGAEKLCLLFRLDPEYATERVVEGDHLTAITTCTLYKITTGQRWGSGQAICSSKESKYAYRKGERTCPECGHNAIIKGRAEYGGGWLCYGKKGGCGAKWPDGATVIEGQNVDRVDNPDLADTWNTIIKMACKRALVAAVLNVTAASDIFTQDIEEIAENTAAATKHNVDYRELNIGILRTAWKNYSKARKNQVVAHEMVHGLLGPLREFIFKLLESPPENQGEVDLYFEWFHQVDETLTTHVADVFLNAARELEGVQKN